MRKLLFVLCASCLISAAHAQDIRKISGVVSMYEMDPRTHEYGQPQVLQIKNYITWVGDEISILCKDCTTPKTTYAVVKRESTEPLGNGVQATTYKVLTVPSGNQLTFMVGEREGVVVSISIISDSFLLMYEQLQDY